MGERDCRETPHSNSREDRKGLQLHHISQQKAPTGPDVQRETAGVCRHKKLTTGAVSEARSRRPGTTTNSPSA